MGIHTKKTDVKASNPKAQPPRAARIRLERTIEQLAAEQGVKPMTNWNDYFGAARHLWESDEDFASFLEAARRPLAERA